MTDAASWVARDLRVNWHPYTQMTTLEANPPVLIDGARGRRLFTADGRALWDGISSWWCVVHGHGHPRLRAAAARQLETLDHVLFAGVTHRPAVELSERLLAVAPPGLARVFYSDDGSTAAEVALKMSLQSFWNRGRPEKRTFLALDRGYHGDTAGCMSVSGVDLFKRAFAPLLVPAHRAPTPDCYRCPAGRAGCDLGCTKALARILEEKGGEIAAVILEPLLLGAGGMLVYPPAFLAEAARLAKAHDVHLIVDEVATGFGRTGTMFACEQAGVTPDFLLLSKGLTNGTLPFAATLTTEAIYRDFLGTVESGRTFFHGHTFTANPLGCAVALANLDVFAEEDTLARSREVGARLQAAFAGFADLPHVGDVRGLGMVAALELVKDRETREPLVDAGLNARLHRRALAEGLYLRPLGSAVYLFLPPGTTAEELEEILDAFRRTLEAELPRAAA